MARTTLADRLADWRGQPLVALAAVTAALAACAASLIAAPGLPGWLGAGLALIMIAIAAIDARFFIIPNELSAAAFALALVNAAVLAPGVWGALGLALLRAAVLGLLFYGLRALYRRLRGREGLGLGDVKLAGVAGAWLDWMSIPIAIEIAALAAISVFAVRYYAGGRTLDTAAKFPFGLFLGPGIWLGWLIEVTLLTPGSL
jgi:leader peptidase (prepilin peptidase) / N-methyltransferase